MNHLDINPTDNSINNLIDNCNNHFEIKGWILDTAIVYSGILLWFKDISGKMYRLIYRYTPKFYLVLRTVYDYKYISKDLQMEYKTWEKRLNEHPEIKNVSIRYKRVKPEDIELKPVLEVECSSPFSYKRVINALRKYDVFLFYNSDLPISQMFFYETGLFPFAFCSIHYRKKKKKKVFHSKAYVNDENHKFPTYFIDSIENLDSNLSVSYELPPLVVIWFEIYSINDLDIHGNREFLLRNTNDHIYRIRIWQDPLSIALEDKIKEFSNHFSKQLIMDDYIFSNSIDSIEIQINLSKIFSISNKTGNRPKFNLKLEKKLLELLDSLISFLDPDIIFTSNGDDTIFPFLLYRAQELGLKFFSFSRDKRPLSRSVFSTGGNNSYFSYGTVYHRSSSQFYLNGRLHIDSAIMGGLHFADGNLYGIVEIARISYVPLQRLTRITIGGALQSLQFYFAYQQNILIAEEKRNSEYFQKASNLFISDRGGHILNPKVGLFSRVAELDFTSMYPSIMVNFNISPEKLNCKCCSPPQSGYSVPELPYYFCSKNKGIVPLSIEIPLKKRIIYKKLSKNSSGTLKLKYERMNEALKWILVVCFGYLGFRNARFGRIEAHQSVCAYARDVILIAKEIAESSGLIVLHGIVDSLYIQAPKSMSTAEFHKLCLYVCSKIERETSLPINYDPNQDFFELISFLPTKADDQIGALNRYWGLKSNSALKVRGLEIRRHDTAPIVKQFQKELLMSFHLLLKNPLFRFHSSFPYSLIKKEILIPLLKKYYEILEEKALGVEDLAITIRLTRKPKEYKVINFQAIAAMKLEKRGVSIYPGMKISYIILNSSSVDPMNRVEPILNIGKCSINDLSFDVMKYKDLLLRAFLNIWPEHLLKSERDSLLNLKINPEKFPIKRKSLKELHQSSLFEYV